MSTSTYSYSWGSARSSSISKAPTSKKCSKHTRKQEVHCAVILYWSTKYGMLMQRGTHWELNNLPCCTHQPVFQKPIQKDRLNTHYNFISPHLKLNESFSKLLHFNWSPLVFPVTRQIPLHCFHRQDVARFYNNLWHLRYQRAAHEDLCLDLISFPGRSFL